MANQPPKVAPNSLTLEKLKEILGEKEYNACYGYPRTIEGWEILLAAANSDGVPQENLRQELELAGFFGKFLT